VVVVVQQQSSRSRGVQSHVSAQSGDGVRSDSAALLIARPARSDPRAAGDERTPRGRCSVLGASHHPGTPLCRSPVLGRNSQRLVGCCRETARYPRKILPRNIFFDDKIRGFSQCHNLVNRRYESREPPLNNSHLVIKVDKSP